MILHNSIGLHSRDRGTDPGVFPPLQPPAWMEDAACREIGTVLFFPEGKGGYGLKLGKQVCRGCPVIDQCLQWGLQVDHDNGGDRHGLYGGLSPRERQRRYGQPLPGRQKRDEAA